MLCENWAEGGKWSPAAALSRHFRSRCIRHKANVFVRCCQHIGSAVIHRVLKKMYIHSSKPAFLLNHGTVNPELRKVLFHNMLKMLKLHCRPLRLIVISWTSLKTYKFTIFPDILTRKTCVPVVFRLAAWTSVPPAAVAELDISGPLHAQQLTSEAIH